MVSINAPDLMMIGPCSVLTGLGGLPLRQYSSAWRGFTSAADNWLLAAWIRAQPNARYEVADTRNAGGGKPAGVSPVPVDGLTGAAARVATTSCNDWGRCNPEAAVPKTRSMRY